MLAQATYLAESGFACHWLRSRSKAPLADDWSKAPVATVRDLKASYRPGMNLGVRLGKPSHVANHFLHLLDVDIRDDAHAAEALKTLRSFAPNYAKLPAVKSGSGGASRHFYFLTDRPHRSKKLAHSAESFVDSEGKKHWAWEIELFGSGKQVVLPPSIHPMTGREYEWLSQFDFELAESGLAPCFLSSDVVDTWSPERTAPVLEDDDDGFGAEVRLTPAAISEQQILATLADLPKSTWCEDRDGWLQVGMALHHQFEGRRWGYDIWTDFSRQSDKFDEKTQKATWKSFKPSPNGIRFPTLIKAAKAAREKRMVQESEIEDLLGPAPQSTTDGEAGQALNIEDEVATFRPGPDASIRPTATKMSLALAAPDLLGLDIRHCTFEDRSLISRTGRNEWRPMKDSDYFEVQKRLEGLGMKNPSHEAVRRACHYRADKAQFDTGQLWLESIPKWDEIPRIDRFLQTYFGVSDGPYATAVSRYIWSAMAGRILVPGVQADMVPVLYGSQGLGKSRGVEAMAPDGKAGKISLADDPKENSRKMRGKVLFEIPEMQGLKTRELETIKAFVSRSEESHVPKFLEFESTYQRRGIFIGTTNERDFLADPTGERRWLPVECGAVDVGAIVRDRDQLWAEAKLLFDRSGVCWQDAQRLAQAEHESYRVIDDWEPLISKWINRKTDDGFEEGARNSEPFLLSHEVAEEAIGLLKGQIDLRASRRIGSILKHLGFTRKQQRVRGENMKVWVR
jgi:hypothetical protein